MSPNIVSLKITTKLLLLLLWGIAAGCARSVPLTPEPSPPGEPPLAPTTTPTLAAPSEAEPSASPVFRIWVPPEFSPDADTTATRLFLARLAEFSVLHPDLHIELRVKAATGPGGLLAALNATKAAAPETLPDLVALPRAVMENAATQGIIFPLDEYAFFEDETDWYEFALQMARVENRIYGVPFACDALVLVSRPAAVGEPPRDWTTTQQLGVPIWFAAGDPRAHFTLALYQAAGGGVLSESGAPAINPATLAAVYQFYADGRANGIFSAELAGLSSEEEVFAAYQRREADMAVVWLSQHWPGGDGETAVSGLPTPGGIPFTPVTGWAWTVANPSLPNLDLSIELIRFLMDSRYLAEWTSAAGYLPPKISALAGWQPSVESALASRSALSGHLFPPDKVVSILGPLLQQTTLDLFNGQLAPTEAADLVAGRLGTP